MGQTADTRSARLGGPVPTGRPRLSADDERRLRDLANALLPRCGEVADTVTKAIIDNQPELGDRGDDDLRIETRASCQANVEEILARLRDGLPASEADPPPRAVSWARTMVHRGVGLDSILRAYRLGHGAFWHLWLSYVREHAEPGWDEAELLHVSSTFMFEYIDAVCARLVDFYGSERERWVRSAAAVRAEVVRQILGGEPVVADEASAALGYDLRRRHVALIVSGDPEDDRAGDPTEAAAQAIAQSAGFSDVLLVPAGRRLAWAWCAVGEDADCDLPGAKEIAVAHDVRIAVGEPASGAGGFARSHDEAAQAFRVATLLARRIGSVSRYRNLALASLLSSDAERGRRFAAAELGALAAEDDGTRRIRATLEIFLEEGSSFVRAARRLGVHENTVAYRVHRAEEMLGHPMNERRLEVEAALLAHRVLGGED